MGLAVLLVNAMSETINPNVEVEEGFRGNVVLNANTEQFETSEAETLREAVDKNDNIEIEDGRDVVVKTDDSIGVGSNLKTAMVQLVKDSEGVNRQKAIQIVLKPFISDVHETKQGEVELTLKTGEKTHGESKEEAVVNYYNEDLM